MLPVKADGDPLGLKSGPTLGEVLKVPEDTVLISYWHPNVLVSDLINGKDFEIIDGKLVER
jgi:hypothetical protein